ncbi:MAG: DUF1572 family protein [Sediminibacterium sp.]|nr:DUF1572 family protein [Sediminibacterium sp.]
MISQSYIRIFEAELIKLKTEIGLYKNESNLWIINGEIKNSAGNLCLHITGSLNYLIGAALGKSTILRQKDEEFRLKNVSKSELIKCIDSAIETVKQNLPGLSNHDLSMDYPLPFGGNTEKVGLVIIYLISHVSYHLGQINYHRRILDI